ncbi:MAG: hypothetical protein HY875_10160 [Chloroflexi bacterium]|nr:hypothetical protein [Chloroflexota bacterium]
MIGERTLSPGEREDLLRKTWYSHDARWFAAVAGEFGMEAANRLNRRIVREIGQVETGRLARALGKDSVSGVGEFLDCLEAGRQLYVAPPLMEMATRAIDERSYEVTVSRCFVAENIQRAGIAGSYDCAVFDRVQGWHDALGLPLAEDTLPPAHCAMAEGRECRRVFVVRGGEMASNAEPLH